MGGKTPIWMTGPGEDRAMGKSLGFPMDYGPGAPDTNDCGVARCTVSLLPGFDGRHDGREAPPLHGGR